MTVRASGRNAATFNEVAALYDEVRPGYDTAIIDAIVTVAGLMPGARILEIGCGSEQITLPLAARGDTITALEPGAALAALAEQNCRQYPRVEIVQSSLESWPTPAQGFDLVLAAQAFHWIDPRDGCARVAAALRSAGSIALVWYLDVSQSTAFWQATQPLYDTYFPRAASSDPPLADKVRWYEAALRESPAWQDVREVRRTWERDYSGTDYLKLLNTFSDHRALPEPNRTAFFQAMADTIDRIGGVVRRRYETVLISARKR
jgi:ubiquinone/menaquinone biosynthesis C-methylase UbiE